MPFGQQPAVSTHGIVERRWEGAFRRKRVISDERRHAGPARDLADEVPVCCRRSQHVGPP